MKRELLAATAITSVVLGYSARVEAQTYNWTGFYIGGVAGYGGLGPNQLNLAPSGSGAGAGLAFPGRLPTFTGLPFATGPFPRLPSFALGSGGFTGGVTLGYNRQYGHWVIGAETDFSSLYNRASGSFSQTTGNRSTFYQASAGTDWLYTLRGRLGYAQDRWLVFGTGGLALGATHLSSNFGINQRGMSSTFTPLGLPFGDPAKGTYVTSRYGVQANGFGSRDDVRVGYVLGGGVEYAVTNHLTLKLEGLYYDLGSDNLLVSGRGQYSTSTTVRTIPFLGPTTTTTTASSGRFTAQPYSARYRFDGAIVRVGLNYKFNAFLP